MSQGLNRVILIGNLGAAPELRRTQEGVAVLTMRLATTESFKNREGERQERTEWHTVKVWGKRADALSQILAKGRSICVEGRIQYSSWEDRDGNKRTSTEIKATDIVLLGGRRDGQQGGGGGQGETGRPGGQSNPSGYQGEGYDDFGDEEIPF